MDGPFPKHHFRQLSTKTEWERCMIRGQRYRVIKAFVDFDKTSHSVGDEWVFLGSNFLPYDDGLSIFVSDEEGRDWLIPLRWLPQAQAHICEQFLEYVTAVGDDRLPD